MKYNAFISYRHTELDMEIAKKLHKGLETFHIPKPVQKKYGKKRIERVFRDQEELPIGSDLDDNITKALTNSDYLIVVCSPRTPESYWVCKEIDSFSVTGRYMFAPAVFCFFFGNAEQRSIMFIQLALLCLG